MAAPARTASIDTTTRSRLVPPSGAAAGYSGASASSSAGRMLRTLRLRTGQSQEQLSARSGISDRTIRGLEGGAVRSPQRATLDRLVVALDLCQRERAALLRAWRDQAHRPQIESIVDLCGVDATAAFGTIAQRNGITRSVAEHKTFVLGAHRGLLTSELRYTFAVTQDEMDRWLYVNSVDNIDAGVRPRVIRTENCRLAGEQRLGDLADVFELSFGRSVGVDETYTFGFTIDQGLSDGALPDQPETEVVAVVGTSGSSQVIEAQFDPAALPERVWQVQGDSVDGPRTRVRPVPVSAFGIAHVVLENPRPGIHGLAWTWPAA